MIASASGWLPFNFPTNWTGSFGPTLAAIIVVAICEGKTGLRALLRPIWQWRFGVGWYFFILIGCSLPFLIGVGLFILLGGSIALSREAIVNVLVQVFPLYPLVLILMGYNYPRHPDLVGITAFTVWCILVGFFLGWLRLKSKSVFPPALGHGAVNAYIGFGLLIAPASNELMTIPFGLPGWLGLLVIATVAYMDLSRTRRPQEVESVHSSNPHHRI